MAKALAILVGAFFCQAASYDHTIVNLPRSAQAGFRYRYQPGLNLSWTLGKSSLDVELSVPVNASKGIGWISVGWSTTGTMGGSDLVFGYVPSAGGSACIRSAAFVVAPDPGPNKPGSFNISDGAFSVANGIAKVSFTRPLTSTQPHPKNVIKTDGPQYVMFGGASAKAHACTAPLPNPPSSCGGVPKDCSEEMGPLGLSHVHDLFNDAACVDFSTGKLYPEGCQSVEIV